MKSKVKIKVYQKYLSKIAVNPISEKDALLVDGQSVQDFIDASPKINSRAFSLMRFLVLTLLAYFEDGLQYRELKSALKVSDGKLISNLNGLRDMAYVKKTQETVGKKKMDVYQITEEGKKELLLIVELVGTGSNIVKSVNQTCQIVKK